MANRKLRVLKKDQLTPEQIGELLGSKTYDSNFHPVQLLNIMGEGLGRATFCAKNRIASQTFANWRAAHPEFDAAYEVGKELSEAWHEEIARKYLIVESTQECQIKFNTTLWSMIMRNRHGMAEHREVCLPKLKNAKTFQGQYRAILASLAEGELTTKEASNLTQVIEAGIKIKESTELENRLNALENALKSGVGEDEFVEE